MVTHRTGIFMLLLLPIFCSCVNTKKATNFNNLSDSTIKYTVENLEPILQKNDILSISVSSVNAEAALPFNLYAKTVSQGTVNAGTSSQTNGFLIDQEGNLQFPLLGKIKAAGLTKKQLKDIITKDLLQKNLLYDPVVDIRYLNYKVTVLGEVIHPSVFNVPSEKITLLEALGLAGDLTTYARRDNILILREVEEGKRVSKRINLNDNDLLTSPYYNLKSNDVVYVAANEAKVASTSTTKQWLPAFISGLSFIAILVDRITR